jgi:hypothetical protein
MSLAEALDYVSHPRRWTIFSYIVPWQPRQPTRPATRGLLDRLTSEQKEKLFAYKGPEASGDQSLPKRPNEKAA